MRITQWGEYGVLCSAFIASRHQNGVATVGASDIATSQGIALQYAQQILHRLRQGGVVESVRGPQGGYRLSKPAAEISLRDVIYAAEGDTFEMICSTRSLGQERCASGECGLSKIWGEFKVVVDDFFSKYSLTDVVTSQNGWIYASDASREQLMQLERS